MSVQRMMTDVKDMFISEMNTVRDKAFKGLVEDFPKARLPENIFVEYFLPLFLGHRTDRPNWVAEWIGVAGSPSAEVEVFNQVTGEVLFTVPGVLATSLVNPASDGVWMHDIFARGSQLNNNIPGSGTNFVLNQLNDKLNACVDDSEMSKEKSGWTYILNRYGYSVQNQQTQETSSGMDDAFEF